MDHFHQIYTGRAADYHQLIQAEDVDGHLPALLGQLAGWRDKRVLDLGTGTGRVPLLLHHKTRHIIGLDLHQAMLRENARQRAQAGGTWSLVQGDMVGLPFPAGAFDVVLAGWAIGHFTGWYPGDWPSRTGRVLAEMQRVLAPAGALFIIETLGTGQPAPAPPTDLLARYYQALETTWGFTRHTLRTDYQFPSLAAAIAHIEFFFGPALAAQVRQQQWQRLPEWTGVWHKPGGPTSPGG